MKYYYKFGDYLVPEDDMEELKAQILNNYTAEQILEAFGEYDTMAEYLDIEKWSEESILESENEDLIEQIGHDPDDYVIPERDYPEYPHEI